ncbi:efflux transporter, RND family, MFP subunit [Candidatus Thiomargarita nelsonii]|uniref:Efflux transporter, RND family, MFP subunit n=1 Tax=Candidatus Thiomargarita nelsonii TaxID=1003181 RepID=A0A176RU20_9GAMM|nr:efflux transporter, RND family, MFP subunit [Candidatus Thiomargarita nelsonii]
MPSKIRPLFWAIWITMLITSCEPTTEQQIPTETVIRAVKTMVLADPEAEPSRHLPGKVHAYQRAELAFRVPGTLIELPVKEAQEVEKGTLLARLDPRDYNTNLAKVKSAIAQARAQLKAMKAGARPEEKRVLQAEVSAAKARYQEAKQQYERYKDLWKKRVISKADYDRQESAYNVAKAQLNTANQNLQKGKAGARSEDIEAMESNIKGLIAQRDEAQDALNDTYLRAPFTGVVAKKLVDNFQNVQAKAPILIFQDISRLDIIINVPEQVFVDAKEPDFYQFVARFEAVPDREFILKVKEHTTEADPKTQTYRGVLTMQAPKDLTILPGMTTTVIVTEKEMAESTPTSIFLVPISTVFADELNKQYVWVVEPNTMTVQKRQIKVGDLTGESIRVLDGLKIGERIVTAGVHFLQEGMKIRLFDSNAGY